MKKDEGETMKIKVPGCSICKIPYDWDSDGKGIIYTNDGDGIYPPLCSNDKGDDKHLPYTDILVEIEVQ